MIKTFALALGMLLIGVAAWLRFGSGAAPQEISTAPQSNEIDVNSVSEAKLFLETFGGSVIESSAGKWIKISGLGLEDKHLGFMSFYPDTVTLYAGHNWFQGSGLKYVADCPQLRVLLLDHTQVNDAGLTHLAKLTNLEKLDLRSTRVTNSGVAHLKDLKQLTSLVLNDTAVDDAVTEHLPALTSLTDIGLENTQITKIGVAKLVQLPSIQRLYLGRTQLGDESIETITQSIQDLKVLDLSDTEISDRGLAKIRSMNSLWNLTIAGTQVTDAGIEALVDAPITVLDIRRTRVTHAASDSLHAMPKLTTVYADEGLISSPEFQNLKAERSLRIKTE